MVIRASRSTGIRYEREVPGDLVHIDVKKLGKIPPGGGWRALGPPGHAGHRLALGYDFIHAAVDDYSRLAYAEILPDEKGTTCAEFWLRAAAWFAARGITVRQLMSDNAMNYVLSTAFAQALNATGSEHTYNRRRRQRALGKLTPVEFELAFAPQASTTSA